MPLVWRFPRLGVFMAAEFDKLVKEINLGSRIVSLSGLTSVSAKAFVLSRLREQTKKKFAVITTSNSDLELWKCDLEFFAKQSHEVSLPSFDTDPYAAVSPHAETLERRALGLWQIAKGQGDIVVASARSMVQRTISRDTVLNSGAEIARDIDIPLNELIQKLVSAGFVREEPIAGPISRACG